MRKEGVVYGAVDTRLRGMSGSSLAWPDRYFLQGVISVKYSGLASGRCSVALDMARG